MNSVDAELRADVLPTQLPREIPTNVVIEPVAALWGHGERVWCVAWSPTANVLASASGDATVKLWSCGSMISPGTTAGETWKCIGTLEGEHTRTVRHISWSPSGEYIACASFDRTATVWRRCSPDSFEFELEGVLDGHESEVKCVSWATDSTLATCSRDHTVWIWDRLDEGEYECAGVLTGHTQDVKHCAWSLPLREGDRPLVVSCGYDNTIRAWADDSHRQDDWHCVQTLAQHEGTVWDCAVQPLDVSMEEVREEHVGGNALPQPLLCSCSDDLSVRFWKRGGGAKAPSTCVAQLSGFCERSIYAVSWAPAPACVVACASGDNSVSLLGLFEDGDGVHVQVVARVSDAHDSDVNSVSFSHFGVLSRSSVAEGSSAGVLLASAGDDNAIRLWRVSSE